MRKTEKVEVPWKTPHTAPPHISRSSKKTLAEKRGPVILARKDRIHASPHYAHHQLLSRKTSSNRSWWQIKVSNGSGVRQERLNGTVGVISTFRTPWHAINSCIKMLVSWHGRACSIHILVSILCSILHIARRYHNINRENVFGLGVPGLYGILRELQVYIVLKLRKILNTIKQVLPLIPPSSHTSYKSKVAIVKNAYARYST